MTAWLAIGSYVFCQGPVSPLVRQLGDPSFKRRLEAEQQLLQGGVRSLEPVGVGARSGDPEIRQRSLRLLGILQKTAFLEQRDRILEDPWTVPAECAPGWEEFHALAGDSLPARELYVQMIDQEGDLMLSLANDPDAWPARFEQRCAEMQALSDRRSQRSFTPTSTATLLFLAVHPHNEPSPLASVAITALIHDGRFTNLVKAPEGEIHRMLVGHWLERAEHVTPQAKLTFASVLRLPSALPAAKQIIDNRASQAQSKAILQNAILYMAQYGGPESIPMLESLLDDQTVVTRLSLNSMLGSGASSKAATPTDVQVSDVALLGLLRLTDQPPEEYGFSNLRIEGRFGDHAASGGFASNDTRQAAIRRWRQWRAGHGSITPASEQDASEGELL